MFEVKGSQEQSYVPFLPALKATFYNRSFITVAIAQSMRFFATGTLQMGMMFYLKYSLGADESLASLIFGITFLVAMVLLYPWRQLVANRTDSRTTLIIANLIMCVGVIPLGLASTLTTAIIAAVIIGIGLSGLVLIGDVIVAEVVDEDEVKTGQQRAGMYFGMSGFIITLSGMLVSVVFDCFSPLMVMTPYWKYNLHQWIRGSASSFPFLRSLALFWLFWRYIYTPCMERD